MRIKFFNRFSQTMTQIVSNIYLGSAIDANNRTKLKKNGVTHILNVSQEVPCFHQNDFLYKKLSIPESEQLNLEQHLDDLTAFVCEGKDSGGVLVHCKFGGSRSAAAVIAYLIKYEKFSLRRAKNLLKQSRPRLQLTSEITKQLKLYNKKIRNQNKGESIIVSSTKKSQNKNYWREKKDKNSRIYSSQRERGTNMGSLGSHFGGLLSHITRRRYKIKKNQKSQIIKSSRLKQNKVEEEEEKIEEESAVKNVIGTKESFNAKFIEETSTPPKKYQIPNSPLNEKAPTTALLFNSGQKLSKIKKKNTNKLKDFGKSTTKKLSFKSLRRENSGSILNLSNSEIKVILKAKLQKATRARNAATRPFQTKKLYSSYESVGKMSKNLKKEPKLRLSFLSSNKKEDSPSDTYLMCDRYRSTFFSEKIGNSVLRSKALKQKLTRTTMIKEEDVRGLDIYKCGKCQAALFHGKDIVRHQNEKNSKKLCKSVFLGKMNWMKCDLNTARFKLTCPKCKVVLGEARVAGLMCSCGYTQSPAFMIKKSFIKKVVISRKA